MALEHPCPGASDIGDRDPDVEADPDRVYEREMERRFEERGRDD